MLRKVIRIGAGAAWSGDQIEPTIPNAEETDLN